MFELIGTTLGATLGFLTIYFGFDAPFENAMVCASVGFLIGNLFMFTKRLIMKWI